jgi:hypothetical protein
MLPLLMMHCPVCEFLARVTPVAAAAVTYRLPPPHAGRHAAEVQRVWKSGGIAHVNATVPALQSL